MVPDVYVSIDGSDKLNAVKENGSIDSESMELQITAIVCWGFCDNHNSRNNAPKFSDPEKLFNIKE